MLLAWAAEDYAAYAAIASALVALGALGLSAYTTNTTLRHERARAAEERLWQRRTDVYIDLIQWTNSALVEVHNRVRSGEFQAVQHPIPIIISGPLGATGVVLASQRVLKATQEAGRRLSDYAGQSPEELTAELDLNHPLAQRYVAAQQALIETIRAEIARGELHEDQPGEPIPGLVYG
jgi:hypothetical protein